jgi:hypothetical protein
MSDLTKILDKSTYKLFLFTFLLGILTYGFTLTTYTISVDNELPILADFGLDVGRWAQNLILYHLFGGHLRYFSVILSLFLFSVAAVQISKLLKFNGFAAFFFCGLFINFPQLSYQIILVMMAVIAALGVLLSFLSVKMFLKGLDEESILLKIVYFLSIALLLMFTLAMYQAFIFIPITLYLILFFQKTFDEAFKISLEIKKALLFAVIIIISGILYSISVKIICPLQQGGYIESFVSGGSGGGFFSNFINISGTNLSGNFFYGEKLYSIASVLIIVLTVNLFLKKKHFIYRLLVLLVLIISPFTLSYFITNGYHPPRIYVTSSLVFAFVITFAINQLKISSSKITLTAVTSIFILNIYFVTMLFSSNNKIYKNDRRVAEKIDNAIQTKYPSFYTTEKSIYFYGYFPYEYHQKYRLDKSEIFGGSVFNWDNGNNYRIINFFREADIAEYNMIDKEKFDLVKDSIAKMPIWPDYESIKMINNSVIVKLGKDKGGLLYFE